LELTTGGFYEDRRHRTKEVIVITGFASLLQGFPVTYKELVLFREYDDRQATTYALPVDDFKRRYKKARP